MKLERIDPENLATNPRANLHAWMQYRDLVEAAFAAAPHVFEATVLDRAPSTVVTRVRDAIRGALAFHHPCSISHSELAAWWAETIVVPGTNSVIFKPKKQTNDKAISFVAKGKYTLQLGAPTAQQMAAVLLLINDGILEGPISVDVVPESINIEDYTNVQKIIDGTRTILL